MAGFLKLRRMGGNALKEGFLSRSFGNAVIDRLNAFCNWRIVEDDNYGIDCSDEGITIRVKNSGTGATSTPQPWDFKPYLVGSDVALQDGTILKSLGINDSLTITGLGDSGAFAAPASGEYIWIHIGMVDGNPSTAEVQSGAPDWGTDPVEIDSETDPLLPVQTAFNLLIAKVVDSTSTESGLIIGDVKIVSLCKTSQILALVPVSLMAVWITQPWSKSA